MKESIGSRVGRLISGSVHALIDAVENAAPDVVMEQAMREIDGAVDEVRAELGKVLATRHHASKRLMEENRRHEELSANIEVALKQGRDDLAEAAVSRQFDIEAQIPVLEHTITDSAAKQKELEGYIAALQARRREMETELAQFRASQRERAAATASVATGSAGTRNAGVAGKVEKAESAFNRAMTNATGVPGSPGNLRDGAKIAELEELARANRIRERLESLKARSKE